MVMKEQVMESSCHDEVVELSIAASEVVFIHEIISGLVSDCSLVSKVVLEAASQLKEARLSVSKQAECNENASNIDYLSDLEDSSMAEAYNDVGLSIACSADLHTIHVPVDHQYARVIPERFVDVTSFLSESPNTAAALDENSFVQGQAKGTFTASQLSTGAQVFGEKTNDQTQVSEDIMTRSSLQSNESVCSVVPCSISCHDMSSSPILDNDGIPSGWNSSSSTEYPTESIPMVATSHDKLACAEQFTHVTLPPLYRRLTTLRPYSVLLHGQSYSGSPLESVPKLTVQNTINKCPINTIEKNCELSEDVAIPPLLKRKEKESRLFLHQGSPHYSRVLRSDSGVKNESMVQKSGVEVLPAKQSHPVQSIFKEQTCSRVPGRKRVRFIDLEDNSDPKQETCYPRRTINCTRYGSQLNAARASGLKRRQYNCGDKHRKKMIFQNIEFMLTGFSNQKEKKLEVLIRKYSGIILSDIPSSQNTRFRRCSRYNNNMSQVVISPKKLQTIKFLFGCAVNALLLEEKWIVDSVAAGLLLPPQRYSILPQTSVADCSNIHCGCLIFGNAGIVLHGKNYFCIEMAKIIQYGGGHVFNSLQSLTDGLNSKKISIGVIVAENLSSASRHLKHCAMEQKIPMVVSFFDFLSKEITNIQQCTYVFN